MISGRNPHGSGSVVVVPVIPGTVLRTVERAEDREPPSRRALPVAAALGGTLAVTAGAIVLFDRAAPSKHAVAPSVPVASVPAPRMTTTQPAPPPASQADLARAAAARLAARLPVTLASTALLRTGSALYVLGGTGSDGNPSDGIWRVDVATGRVTTAGQFVEPLTNSGAAARGGVLYLAGGWTGDKEATGVLRWSPGKSSSLVTRLPVPVRSASAAFIDGHLWVVGSSPRRVFEVDVDAGTVTERTAAPKPVSRAKANLAYLIAATRAAQSR